jgi:hypothetical protein
MRATRYVILILRSNDLGAGIAGKDFGEIRGLWPETAIAFPPQLPQQMAQANEPNVAVEDALVALAGRHVKWTRLAVQQQLIEPDSHADHSTSGANGTAASIRALLLLE